MSIFLTQIQVNKIFHLENISIDIDMKEKKHLIITGKNGSGKSSLLKAIAEFLEKIRSAPNLSFYLIQDKLNILEKEIERRKRDGKWTSVPSEDTVISNYRSALKSWSVKLELKVNGHSELSEKLEKQDFLLSSYKATRAISVVIPKNPEKPNLRPAESIYVSKTTEFIKFLIDLKVQEALARNENETKEADDIKTWFESFTLLLSNLFEGDKVFLDFNYKNYSFTINQNGRKFGFDELSDGYSAIIDIIADLIIKMQSQDTLTRAYEMEGIVLIDEIETHLHLKLQRLILPMLTKIFKNIQFIVTTHSPFVLNSIPNAVAYDLEKRVRLENLTEYSYEALAEGYFKVETDSSFLLNKLDRFRELSEIADKDAAEQAAYEALNQEFASMDELLTPPSIKGQYLEIKLGAK